ncbi:MULTISPECIES: hypothetical protein [Rhodococcus]|uniref:hypothetical protein n=1 Tax=Rhodococcus TaxID=1827 RepID=UPI0012FD4FC5|nr:MULTISPECIES: hypothetical protein [Rhodococcus]MXQ78438.1 hypothetical protein [Rhodococcus rhodochrous]
MRRGLLRTGLLALGCAAGVTALTACGGASPAADTPPSTVTSYVTVTETVPATTPRTTSVPATTTPSTTASSTTSPVAVPPTTTAPTTTAPTTTSAAPAVPVVTSVTVLTERSGLGHLIGPDMYEATSWGKASVIFRWRAQTADGELWKETCQVVSTVTGPGGYVHNDRSAACSGRMRANELVLGTPGVYMVTTEVVGPEGLSTAVGTKTFEVFPDSTP